MDPDNDVHMAEAMDIDEEIVLAQQQIQQAEEELDEAQAAYAAFLAGHHEDDGPHDIEMAFEPEDDGTYRVCGTHFH